MRIPTTLISTTLLFQIGLQFLLLLLRNLRRIHGLLRRQMKGVHIIPEHENTLLLPALSIPYHKSMVESVVVVSFRNAYTQVAHIIQLPVRPSPDDYLSS